jgi:hypothetical protein
MFLFWTVTSYKYHIFQSWHVKIMLFHKFFLNHVILLILQKKKHANLKQKFQNFS